MKRTAADYRRIFKEITTSGSVVAADTTVASVAGRSKYTLFIQEIIVDILTDAAFTVIFRDSNGTPKVIMTIPASPGVGPQRGGPWGDEGIPLTEGKNLDIVLSGAGLAFNYKVVGYLKPTATMIPSEI